jgi:hypothetical protein
VLTHIVVVFVVVFVVLVVLDVVLDVVFVVVRLQLLLVGSQPTTPSL